MKKLEDAIVNVKYGSILTINKYGHDDEKKSYASCLMLFDGKVFKDVKEVELGNLLSMIPNIQKELDNGYIYKVNYLREENKYQSNIVRCIRKGGYKEIISEEIVNNFEVLSDNFLDSIIELDTKIAKFNSLGGVVKKKVIA